MAIITGTPGADRLVGTSTADTVSGRAGNDTLAGGAGADVLNGGSGNDELTGNTGHDILHGDDGIDLARYDGANANLTVNFRYAGTVAYAGIPANDDRLYDIERLWTGRGDDLVTIGARDWETREVDGGAGDDTLVGGDSHDVLRGGTGADLILGGDGADTLAGGSGADSLAGGAGFDTALYDDALRGVAVDLAAGTATVTGGGTDALATIEAVVSGDGADTLRGDGGANDLRSRGGDDLLNGRGGNDTLDGGAGRDTLNGGAGSDTVRYASHVRGMTIDLAHGTATATGTAALTDTLVSIENAIGGQGNDHLLGSSLGQALDGGLGADTVAGAGGDDTLTGGLGNDLVQGGDGNDQILGARVIYPETAATDPQGSDRFFDALVDDGRDTLDGGAGSDTLVVPSATYRSDWGTARGLLDAAVNLAAGAARVALDDASTDRLVSIENVTTHDGDDTVHGSAGANVLSVGNGSNIVHAGAGNDTIVGGAEDDTASLGTWQDELHGDRGNDRIVGNGSLETFPDSAMPALAADYLDGGAGNDTLVGGIGTSVMVGGDGADRFESSNAAMGFPVGDYLYAFAERPEIRDFDPNEGDKLVIDIVENLFDSTPRFVGQVTDLAELDEFDIGYMVDGDDMVVRFVSEHDGPWTRQHDDDLTIRLTDYDGGLIASDIVFL